VRKGSRSPTTPWGGCCASGATAWAQCAGWVSVGTDHDTAAFAVATLARWWEQTGRQVYPQATRLGMTVRPEFDHGGYPT
jgi:hypothetical protein